MLNRPSLRLRNSVGLFLFFLVSLATAGTSHAAVIGITGTTLVFAADGSEGDLHVVGVSPTPSTVSLFTTDPFTILTPACSAIAGGVECQLSGIDLLALIGADGNDTFDMSGIGAHLNLHLSGKGGNDLLIAGSGNDTIKGGPGMDTIDGGLGVDVIALGDSGPADPAIPTAVPEPGTLLLLGSGTAVMGARRLRARSLRSS